MTVHCVNEKVHTLLHELHEADQRTYFFVSGPIWINVNFQALGALPHNSPQPGAHAFHFLPRKALYLDARRVMDLTLTWAAATLERTVETATSSLLRARLLSDRIFSKCCWIVDCSLPLVNGKLG